MKSLACFTKNIIFILNHRRHESKIGDGGAGGASRELGLKTKPLFQQVQKNEDMVMGPGSEQHKDTD